MNIGVLILVGGKSTRMGKSKADLKIEETTFLDHIASKFKGYPIYVSQNKYQSYEDQGYTTIVDEYDDIGPMGGIVSCFHQCKEEYLFVVACDMPFMDAVVLQKLETYLNGYDGVFVDDGNHLHLLGGIYSRTMTKSMETAIGHGMYALYRCVKQNKVNILLINEISLNENRFHNINTSSEYSTLIDKTINEN